VNSKTSWKLDLHYQKYEVEIGIRKALDGSSKFVDVWRSLKLKMRKLKMFRLCKW